MTGAPHPVRVALIGCGLIGSLWDEERDALPHALTHARAFSRHAGARLVACCDADLGRAQRAAARWGAAAAYADPARLFAEQAVDLAVVASASAARAAVIAPALAAGVRTLVIEKPLATTLDESRRLVAALDEVGARALVNYLRHWDPAMVALRERIAAGGLGPLQRLLGLYGKGLTNNASHLIDLAATLSGARPVRARSLGSPLPTGEADWSQGADRALDAQVELQSADGQRLRLDMVGTDMRDFTCFELRIFGRDAVVELSQGGRRLAERRVQDDPDYPGYRIPGEPQPRASRALEAFDRMADEAVALAAGRGAAPSCSAHDALRIALTVDAIQRSEAAGGAWCDVAA